MSGEVLRPGWRPVPCPDLPDGIVLFDGVCVLCSRWLRFVAHRDPGARFRFAAVQGPYGRQLAERLGIDPGAPQTNVVIVDGMAFFRSDAAIEVLRRLPGWRWASVLKVVPRQARDWLYDIVACNRYALFGRTASCLVPTPGLQRHVVVEPGP